MSKLIARRTNFVKLVLKKSSFGTADNESA